MSGNKKVTIKTIANELGISFSTVSKALNNNPLIKKQTRDLVFAKAQEMGYLPDMNAKSLRNRTTLSIGIILNDIENPTLAHILCNVTRDMANLGYTTLICDSRYDEEMENRNINTVISRQANAIILEPVTTRIETLEMLMHRTETVILLSDAFPGFNSYYVHVNHQFGGYLAAKEMIMNGHTRNIIITEIQSTSISRQYVTGIKKAYAEYGLPFDESLLFHCVPSISNGCQIILENKDLFSLSDTERVTGVLCNCDSLAYGVYQAASLLGLSIPSDISVIGFDDYSTSAFVQPSLSTIYLPKERMAECCTELLKNILIEKNSNTKFISLEPHLVSRQSIRNRYLDPDT